MWCKWTRCWWKKRMLRKKKRLDYIWVKSESDLDQISTKSLTSLVQSWYARNITFLFENSCLHECSLFARFLLIVISIFSAVCLNITYEIHSKLSLSHRIFLYRHSIICCFYLDLFIWLCTIFNLDSVWSSIYHLSFNVHCLQ